jgi:hypothetical protein
LSGGGDTGAAALAARVAARWNAPMSLPPLRTLFFEDLSVGLTDFAICAGSSSSAQKHARLWRS